MDDKEKIGFNVNEQNALALLCEMMAKANHDANSPRGEIIVYAAIESISDVVEKFPSINWGDLYDRFHRQGVNR